MAFWKMDAGTPAKVIAIYVPFVRRGIHSIIYGRASPFCKIRRIVIIPVTQHTSPGGWGQAVGPAEDLQLFALEPKHSSFAFLALANAHKWSPEVPVLF
jgi:hypothetical protein